MMVFEGIARLTINEPKQTEGMLEADPLLHHRYTPKLDYMDRFRSVHYLIHTNSQSWVMDYEVSKEKAQILFVYFTWVIPTQRAS